MRSDLETTKQIEFYLTNNMSDVERRIFEKEMELNLELRHAVEQQKNLMKAMEKSYIKDLAVSAGIKYRRTRRLVAGAAILAVIVLVTGVFAIYDYIKDQPKQQVEINIKNPIVSEGQPEMSDPIVADSTVEVYSNRQMSDFVNTIPMVTELEKKSMAVSDSGFYILTAVKTNEIKENVTTTFVEVPKDSVAEKPLGKVNASGIFEQFQTDPQIFNVSADKKIHITGAEGTVIDIPAESLVDERGHPIKGPVSVELKEYYQKSDIILGNLHTMADGQLLESGGMIHVNVSQDGRESIQLKDGKTMSIKFKGKTEKDSMLIFDGEAYAEGVDWSLNKLYYTTYDTIYWNKPKKLKGAGIYRGGTKKHTRKTNDTTITTINPGFGDIVLETGKLGWINCDKFCNYTNRSTLTVKFNKGYAPIIRLVFTKINSTVSTNENAEDHSIFWNIPVGMEMHIVAFTTIDGQPYFGKQKITMTTDHIEWIDLQKTSLESLEFELKKLNTPDKKNDTFDILH